jgi:hypothetical protein
MMAERIIIYPKDVQRITGKSDRYARLLLRKIRDHFNKDVHQFVSVNDFCAYTGLALHEVERHLEN